MYCRNCGKEVIPGAVACMGCGVAPNTGNKHCQNCGALTEPIQIVCVKCGAGLGKAAVGGATTGKNKVAAGILGILLGGLGIHKFYLGYSKEGAIMLAVSLLGVIVTLGLASVAVWIVGLIEGIVYLTKSDEEFEQTYVRNKRGWF